MIAIYPVLAMLLGGAVYAFSNHPKLAELGRLVFGSGALVFVYIMAGHAVHLP